MMAQGGIEDSIVRVAALAAVPWANGGGVTRVIANRSHFRLSLATIAEAGPFSSFPGLVRHFALIAGRIDLSVLSQELDSESPPVTFDGAMAVHARPLGGLALALNLMVPAGAPPLRLERCTDGALSDAVAVFACAAMTVGGFALAPHDTLIPDGPVHLSGLALVVR